MAAVAPRATTPARSTTVNYQSKSMSPSPLCSETAGRELKHCTLQYKINIFLSDCLLVALGHHGTRLPPDYVQTASRLPPDRLQITSRLPPDYLQIDSRLPPDARLPPHYFHILLPDCLQITFRLLPDYIQITSMILPDYFQIASRLLPNYFFRITSLYNIQITSRLLPDCFQITSRLLP